MDLGLGQLTDDQLLELVHEVCRELALRDPYVRAMAQHTITTESDRLVLRRAMLKEAVTAVAGSYVEQIRGESFREVQEGVRTGRIRLLTPAQEARILVDSTLEAKIKLIDETVTAIQHGKLPSAQGTQPKTKGRRPTTMDTKDYNEFLRAREEQIRAGRVGP